MPARLELHRQWQRGVQLVRERLDRVRPEAGDLVPLHLLQAEHTVVLAHCGRVPAQDFRCGGCRVQAARLRVLLQAQEGPAPEVRAVLDQ